MMADHPLGALAHEIRELPRLWQGLRRRGFSTVAAVRFLLHRLSAPEPTEATAWTSGRALRTPGGIQLYNRRDDVAYQQLFLLDEYMKDAWVPGLQRHERPLVLDVGANIGFFTALCLAECPKARIHAFELIPECEPLIRMRMKEGGLEEGGVVMAAMGSSDEGFLDVHYDAFYDMTNSVGRGGARMAHARRRSLDAWADEVIPGQSPALVKIDVEGAEGDVVAGARRLLSRSETILMELHGDPAPLRVLQETHTLVASHEPGPDLMVAVLRRTPVA